MSSSQRDIEYSFVVIDIENNSNNYVFNVKVHNNTVISHLIQNFHKKLKESGVQLQEDYSSYGVYYDPNSVDNIVTQQKENKQGIEQRRGSTRLKSSIMKPKTNLSPITNQLSTSLSITEATPSAWRELAKMANETNKSFFFLIDDDNSVNNNNTPLIEDDENNQGNDSKNENNIINISEVNNKVTEEEFEVGKKYSGRARNRASSIDLGGLSEVMNAGNQGYWLVTHKTIGAYHFPSGCHLLYKITSPSTPQIDRKDSAPVLTGAMNFIRVYNASGSYKTLYRPEDTPAYLLYEELAEKFVLENWQSYAIFLLKNGLETLLGDESTPLKLIKNMSSKEIDDMRFIFKDAGNLKGKTGKKKPKVKPLLNLISSALKNGELNLSFQHVDEYPNEYFQLTNLETFTYNSGNLYQIPPLAHLVNLTELRLVNNNLNEVPAEIFKLTNLIELDMGNNLIKELPGQLSTLINLRELYFYANQISSIPHELTQLSFLSVINLAYNFFTKLPDDFFQHFENLEQLKFSGNQLSSIPNEIFNITTIVDLNLSRNSIKVLPDNIGNLIQLRWLDVKENQIELLPESICTLRFLEELIVSGNQLKTLPSTLKTLKLLLADKNKIALLHENFLCDEVEEIDLSHNLLEKLPNSFFQPENKLTKLNLSNNRLTYLPDTIVTLESLTQLNARENQIETLPNHLGDLPLKVLDLSHNKITKLPSTLLRNRSIWFLNCADNPLKSLEGLIKFGVVHRQLADCYFGKNQLTSEAFQFFSNIKNIRTLDLGYNLIKSIPSSLTKYTSLQILFLAGNKLTSIPTNIGKLQNLKELYLSCNFITSLPSSMKYLLDLRIFDISHNQLTGSVSVLSKITTLEWIDISYNPGMKTIPFDELTKLPNLKVLHTYAVKETKKKILSNSSGIALNVLPQSANHLSHHDIQLSKRFTMSWSDMQGRRDGMEDKMVLRGNFINEESDFFCVLDGHGGKTVAEFGGSELAFKLEHELRDHLSINNNNNNNNINQRNETLLQTIRKVFMKVHESIGAAEIGVMQGATAVAALICSNYLYVGNVGDTRAVLCRNGVAVRLSFDHKPELPEEEKRIRTLGGYVADDNRVNSILAVSRAFGDFALEKFVLCDPFLSVTELKKDDLFLIIACDGVWDVMSDQQACDIVLQYKEFPLRSASILRDHAFMYSSMDNVSCIVIHLT